MQIKVQVVEEDIQVERIKIKNPNKKLIGHLTVKMTLIKISYKKIQRKTMN
jgi:hypothetical protein